VAALITDPRRADIEVLAAGVRAQLPETEFTFGQRRFDVRLAAALVIGGQVAPQPNLRHEGRRVSGLYVPGAAISRIMYEAHEPPIRQRFTIAHELGHATLDPARQPACDPPMADGNVVGTEAAHDDVEEEADAFAACFLMPATLLGADVATYGRCAALLADLYEVSEPAMRARLLTLDATPP
jgi:hypothetical protein